jgi:hypothetical protein
MTHRGKTGGGRRRGVTRDRTKKGEAHHNASTRTNTRRAIPTAASSRAATTNPAEEDSQGHVVQDVIDHVATHVRRRAYLINAVI